MTISTQCACVVQQKLTSGIADDQSCGFNTSHWPTPGVDCHDTTVGHWTLFFFFPLFLFPSLPIHSSLNFISLTLKAVHAPLIAPRV